MDPFTFQRVFPGVVYNPAVGSDGGPEQVGQGGAGRVLRFVAAEGGHIAAASLPPEIAVKEISLLAGAITRTQVEREVTIAMNLNHPNIVRVYDYDMPDSSPGTVRIAMDIVQGCWLTVARMEALASDSVTRTRRMICARLEVK